ncbi:MAG: POTRA domain-containing protein [Kofleriaceae bacterium]|nr:POTRA domain-containing protein [Kofleriaceae bacterium]
MRSLLLVAAIAGLAGCEAKAAVVSRAGAGAEVAVAKPNAKPNAIESVAIDGDNLPLAVLRDVLTTRPGGQLDPQTLVDDRTALERALAARGYLAAHVEPAEVSFAAGSAFVTFPVEQGAMFKVRSIRVSGATERDAGVLTLAVGDPAIEGRIQHARQLLADHLARRGKLKQVSVQVTRDEAAAAVDVELIVL